MRTSRPAPTGEKLACLARKAIDPYEPGSSIAALYAACCSSATIGQLPVWSLLLTQAGLNGDNAPDPSGRAFTFDAAAHARAVLAAHDRNTVEDLHTRILPTGDSSPADPLPFHAWSQLVADAVPKAPAGPIRHEWQQALAANQAMHDALGTSFDEIFAVLALAPSTATTSETTEIAVEDLALLVAAWSGLDPLGVAAAIGQLTLTPAILRAEGLNVGRREGRAARLATRPFVPVGEKSVLVMPRRIDAAGQLILAYISTARLPWPGLPAPVVDAVARWSQARQKAFEIHLEDTAKPGRFKLIPRLKPGKARRRGLTIAGEIDLLVIDPSRRRVWVIEAKAGHSGIDPDKILHDLVEFHGRPPGSSHPRWDSYRRKTPFVDRLLEKTGQIKAQLPNLLASERVDHVGEWTVHPLFVTRTPPLPPMWTILESRLPPSRTSSNSWRTRRRPPSGRCTRAPGPRVRPHHPLAGPRPARVPSRRRTGRPGSPRRYSQARDGTGARSGTARGNR